MTTFSTSPELIHSTQLESKENSGIVNDPKLKPWELEELGLKPKIYRIHNQARDDNFNLRKKINNSKLEDWELKILLGNQEQENNSNSKEEEENSDTPTLEDKINTVKGIKLNYKLDLPKWSEFKKDSIEKAIKQGLKGEKLETYKKFLDKTIHPMYTRYSKLKEDLNSEKFGDNLNILLDKVENSVEGPNGEISIDLNDLDWSDELKDFFINILYKIKGEKAPRDIKFGIITFNSKEEAVDIIGLFKKNLSEYKEFDILKFINDNLSNFLYYIGSVVSLGGLNLEILWWKLLGITAVKYANFSMEYPLLGFVGGIIAYIGIWYFNNTIMDRILTGVDDDILNSLNKKIKDTIKIYDSTGSKDQKLKDKIKKLKDLYKDLNNSYSNVKGGPRDNYKVMKDYYRLLSNFQESGIIKGIGGFSASIGSTLDNGKFISIPVKADLMNPVAYIKTAWDISLFPIRFFSTFINKGPDGKWRWDLGGKGSVIIENDEAFGKFNKKMTHIFNVIDNIDELKSDEKAKLKADILNIYDSSRSGAAVSPLYKKRYELMLKNASGKYKIPTIEEIYFKDKVSEKIEKVLKDKLNYDIDVERFINEIDTNFSNIEKSMEEIDARKKVFDNLIKYHPKINGETEKKLLSMTNIIASLSIDENEFTKKFENLLDKKMKIKFSSSSRNIDEIFKNIKNLSEEFEHSKYNLDDTNKNIDIRKYFNDTLNKLNITADEKRKRTNIFNEKLLLGKNRTYWEPHLVIILDQILHGANIDPEIEVYEIDDIKKYKTSTGLHDIFSYGETKLNNIDTAKLNNLKKIERYIKIASLYGDTQLMIDFQIEGNKYLISGDTVFNYMKSLLRDKKYINFDEINLEKEIRIMEKIKTEIIEKAKKGKYKFSDADLIELEKRYGTKSWLKSLFENLKKGNIN